MFFNEKSIYFFALSKLNNLEIKTKLNFNYPLRIRYAKAGDPKARS
jgi:hypothetical protein